MGSYFASEIRRAILSRSFLVGIALAVAGMAAYILPKFEFYPDLAEMGRTGAQFWFIWMHDGYTSLFASVIATIPFAVSYAQERNSGFSRFVLQRLSVFRYSVVKLVSNALAGGLVLALPSAAALIWVTATFPMTPRIELNPSIFFSNLPPPEPLVYMSLQVMAVFLYGALSATVGLAASVLFRNAFYANVFPFTLGMVFGFVFSFAGLGHLSSAVMWSPSVHINATVISFAAQHLVVWTLSLGVYMRFFKLRSI